MQDGSVDSTVWKVNNFKFHCPRNLRAHTHTAAVYATLQMLSSFIFSLFMSSVRPRPDAHPTLYLVVVGGVAPSELRCVHEAIAASKTNVHVSS